MPHKHIKTTFKHLLPLLLLPTSLHTTQTSTTTLEKIAPLAATLLNPLQNQTNQPEDLEKNLQNLTTAQKHIQQPTTLDLEKIQQNQNPTHEDINTTHQTLLNSLSPILRIHLQQQKNLQQTLKNQKKAIQTHQHQLQTNRYTPPTPQDQNPQTRPLKPEEKQYLPLTITDLQNQTTQTQAQLQQTTQKIHTLAPILENLLQQRIQLHLLQNLHQELNKREILIPQPIARPDKPDTTPKTTHDQGQAVLLDLISNDQFENFEKFVLNGGNINLPYHIPNLYTRYKGFTALYYITKQYIATYDYSYLRFIQWLLEHGANPTPQPTLQNQNNIQTPLYLAATAPPTSQNNVKKQIELIQLLLNHNALPLLQNDKYSWQNTQKVPNPQIRQLIDQKITQTNQDINQKITQTNQLINPIYQELTTYLPPQDQNLLQFFGDLFSRLRLSRTTPLQKRKDQIHQLLIQKIANILHQPHNHQLLEKPQNLTNTQLTTLCQENINNLHQQLNQTLQTLQPFYKTLCQDTLQQIQHTQKNLQRNLFLHQIHQDENTCKQAYTQATQNIQNAQKALDHLQAQLNLLSYQRQLLLNFRHKIQQHKPLPAPGKQDLTTLNNQDTHQKTLLTIAQHLHYTTYEIQRLQHEKKTTQEKVKQLQQQDHQKRIKSAETKSTAITIAAFLTPVAWPFVNSIHKTTAETIANSPAPYQPQPQLIDRAIAYLYADEIKNNLTLNLGTENPLIIDLRYLFVEKLTQNFTAPTPQQATQTYQNHLHTRTTFLQTYAQEINQQLNHYKDLLHYFQNKQPGPTDTDEKKTDSDDEDEEDPDLPLNQGALQAIQSTLQHLQNLQNTLAIEQLALQLETQILDQDKPELYSAYYCQLHPNAYTRRELQNAQKSLHTQQKTLHQKAENLQTDLATHQNKYHHIIIEKTPTLIKLLDTHSNLLQSNLTGCINDITTLQLRHTELANIIHQRQQLATALGMATRLLAPKLIVLVIGTATGPIGIVLAAAATQAATTAAGKAVEDLVLNGGDLQGFEEDFCTTQTASQVTTSALIGAGSGCLKTLDLVNQAQLNPLDPDLQKFVNKIDPKTFKRLSKLAKITHQNPITQFLQPYTEKATFEDFENFFNSPKPLAGKTALNIVKEFSQSTTRILVGTGVDQVIEHLYPDQTPPNTHITSHDPQNPNYNTSHPQTNPWDKIQYAAIDAILAGVAKSIAEIIGDKYDEHRNSNTTLDNPLPTPTVTGYLKHKGAHALLGATYGASLKAIQGNTTPEELLHAATSGATGALVGEIVAECIQTATLKNLVQQKGKLSQEQFNEIYQKHIKNAALAGKLVNLATAYNLDLDIEIASRTANNAIENNFLATAFTIGLVAWTLYDAYYKIQEAQEIYQKQGWEAARNYALKEISKEVLLYIAAAGTGKLLGKLAKTPAAKKFFSALQKELGAGLKKVEQKLPKLAKQGLAKSKNLLTKAEQKSSKKALQKTETSLLRQAEKQSLKTAEKQFLKQGTSLNLNQIFKPNGKLIGKQLANKETIRTVTKKEAQNLLKSLERQGAKLVNNPKYPGKWYQLPSGKGFGIRTSNYHASLKHGTPSTIDVYDLGVGLKKIKY